MPKTISTERFKTTQKNRSNRSLSSLKFQLQHNLISRSILKRRLEFRINKSFSPNSPFSVFKKRILERKQSCVDSQVKKL